MKKTTLTLALLFAVSALIYAGPEAISGKEMKQVAPVPPPCFNWTGFYAGAFGGYKFASVDVSFIPDGAWDGFPADQDAIRSHGPGDLNTSGGELGGLLGYNYQWRCWVFGVEADGGYLWLRDSYDSGTFPAVIATDKSIQSAFRTHYLFTFAPRIGYSFGKWLPYVTGGLAVGDFEFEQRLHNVSPNGVYFSEGDEDETHAGWMVGGGLQYALNERWSVRGQYQYIDLGSITFREPGSAGFDAFSTTNGASLHEHNASFAIMYHF
jgi:outer membrane immunogenic protein